MYDSSSDISCQDDYDSFDTQRQRIELNDCFANTQLSSLFGFVIAYTVVLIGPDASASKSKSKLMPHNTSILLLSTS
jgi:hypothetical protein